MAGEAIDKEELGKFEVALLTEFAKRGFEMNLSGDNVTYQSQKTKQGGSADMAELFTQYKAGRGIPQIVDQAISSPSAPPQKPAAAQPPAERASPPQSLPKLDLERIYPLIRGPDFLAAYKSYLEKQSGGPLAPDHPSMPKVFLFAKDHQVYIFCGLDVAGKYAYVDNRAAAESGVGEMDLFRKMMQNLMLRMDPIMSGRQFRAEKVLDGAYTFRFPDGLASSFLLIANRYYDIIAETTMSRDAKYFYAFSISGDEMMVAGSSLNEEGLKQAVTAVYQKQVELTKNPETLIVRVEPMVIMREGMTFPAPRQPSPTH